ncbi:MAG TPA: glycosyltransferase [bacterium]|nr:glycosyltransferase [bacterium]
MEKVALIAPGFHPVPPVKGAAVETWIDEVAGRMTAYEPWIISCWDPQRPVLETVRGVHHRRVRFGALYTRLFKKITRIDPYPLEQRIARFVAGVCPAVIHLHNRFQFLGAMRKELAGAHVPIVLHVHNKFTAARAVMPEFDVLAGCSRYILDFACESFGGFQGERVVLPNGVDTQKFRPRWELPEESRRLRRELGVEDSKVILFVGRVSPEKGINTLISAFPRVLQRHPDAALVVIGEIRRDSRGDGQRMEYAKSAMSMARPYGDRIKFLDVIPPSEIHRYYLLGDLFVAPSLEGEAFGMVFLEAAASGLPIVSSRRGGIPEAVSDGRNGILLDHPEDPEQLAGAICSLLDDPARSRALAEWGRARVEREFDWSRVTREVENLYGSLLRKQE